MHLARMNSTRTAKRGALTKEDSKAVLIYFPKDLIPLIDRAVQLTDTDRSKFIRASVRDHLRRIKVA
jgi:metal-responsive CopG/Arc/MetJ family transcriptional regulator